MAEARGYTVSAYGQMIQDRGRMAAYAAALKNRVAPGGVVADIGAGPGVFSLLACQYGARRVYAIEPADVICLAREVAAANGYGDRIQFFQAVSTRVALPSRRTWSSRTCAGFCRCSSAICRPSWTQGSA